MLLCECGELGGYNLHRVCRLHVCMHSSAGERIYILKGLTCYVLRHVAGGVNASYCDLFVDHQKCAALWLLCFGTSTCVPAMCGSRHRTVRSGRR